MDCNAASSTACGRLLLLLLRSFDDNPDDALDPGAPAVASMVGTVLYGPGTSMQLLLHLRGISRISTKKPGKLGFGGPGSCCTCYLVLILRADARLRADSRGPPFGFDF